MFLEIILFFIIGTALGSFSLVLAWRMHDKKDWVRGRSACEDCNHVLSADDMIPMISWLALRGKCRYCKKPLSKQLLYAELLLGTVLTISWVFWPYDSNNLATQGLFVLWAISLVIMSALFWYDLRWYTLPNKLVYPLISVGILYRINAWILEGFKLYESIIMPILAISLISGLFFVLYKISNGKWIGFGDVRLGFALGLFIGNPLLAWVMIFFASVFGILFALPGIVSGKTGLKTKIPFGPLLILATYIVVLFGQKILDMYLGFVGV
jgi:leader peptidase (prepilin peptidase)/N-methyltransferase